MLSYYRRTFNQLALLVNRLEDDKDLAQVSFEIQELLIKKIRYTEGKIKYWKNKLPTSKKVKAYQRINKTLRCFGDAIAFKFMDRWYIKQLSLNHNSGFISGQSGFELEYSLLKEASNIGIPCLLADLTNCLRHGDLYCFFPDSDPKIIEVKDGNAKKSGRASRQKKKLNQVLAFLETDKKLVDGKLTKRVDLPSELIDNSDLVSELASKAVSNGSGWAKVKNQAAYFAMVEFDDSVLMKVTAKFKKPCFSIVKSDEYFSMDLPFYPIPLIVKDPIALTEFLVAEMVFLVVIDLYQIEKAVKKHGASFEYLGENDGNYSAKVVLSDGAVKMVSKFLFSRLFYEFLDIDWFASLLAQPVSESVLSS